MERARGSSVLGLLRLRFPYGSDQIGPVLQPERKSSATHTSPLSASEWQVKPPLVANPSTLSSFAEEGNLSDDVKQARQTDATHPPALLSAPR